MAFFDGAFLALELIAFGMGVIAVCVGFSAIVTMGFYAFLHHFGALDRASPAPQTSEQMEEV